MASVTVDSSSGEGPLQSDSIPAVDLRLLSQSELYSLSLCSSSAFNPQTDDDVVIPKIDRTVFNESAGSRKQTYSRLRLAPAASPAALRSRTPHLRNSPHPLSNPSSNNDPENSQIVTLLKQLFGSGTETRSNLTDLVPIQVDYTHSVTAPVPEPVSVPELGNVGLIGQKRRRGRPRRNENGVSEVKRSDVAALKDIVVYENVDDPRDKEMLNKDGERVDLAVLGALEDPYGEELRRRTQGMVSEEELLRFMERMNGQWGSTRKKKRIVDAGEFGNALPKGWKLLLSVKKKEGRVWLHCRRYISPNGRRFDTCKEISSYLLFLHGERNENPPTNAKSSETVETSNTCALGNTSDLRVQDGSKKESPPFHNSSPATGHGELQALVNFGELSEVQVGDLLHCDKCNVTFNDKDDLLQHQLSSHRRRRSRNGQSITDGVIIKEGKFECQFCHKTFEERHRYNGHIGAHVKNQVKSADGSLSINMGECVEPVLLGGAMLSESTVHNSVVSLTENAHVSADVGYNPAPPSTIEEEDHMDTDNKQDGPSEAMDTDRDKTNLCLSSEADTINKKDDIYTETINGSLMVDNVAEGLNKGCHNQEKSSESCSPTSLNEKTCLSESKETVSPITEEPKPEGLPCSNGIVDSCGVSVEDGNFPPTVDESKAESDRFVDNESVIALHTSVVLDHSGKNINILDVSSMVETSKENRDLKSSTGAPSCDEEGSGVLSGCLGEKKSGGMWDIKNDECRSLADSNDNKLTTLKGHSSLPHPDNHENTSERDVSDVSTCFLKEPEPQKANESGLLSPACDKNTGVEAQLFNDSKVTIEEPKMSELQSINSNRLGFSSCDDYAVQKSDANDLDKENSLAFDSLFPSMNVRASSVEDHDNKVYQRTVDVNDQQRSADALFSSTYAPQASSAEEYTMNRIYPIPLNEPKFGGLENFRHHDLNVVFGNSQVDDLCAKPSSTHQNRYAMEKSTFQLGMEQTYGVQDNLCTRLETNKQGEVGIDLSDSAFKGKTGDFESSFDMGFHGQLWDERKVDEVGGSGKKIITGFGCGSAKPNEDVMVGSIWRTGIENVMPLGTADNTTSAVQSSNCFQTYDMSDKVQDLFGENEKYDSNTGFDGLRSDRSGPVEYSFMTTPSLNSLQEEPRVLPSFDMDIEQGFNSSFWLGKDDLMPNIAAGRNQVTLICVWCRNEFYQDPNQLGAEAGSIGSICPSCSGRMSGQFSFL